jgi:ankyrin repeat protein
MSGDTHTHLDYLSVKNQQASHENVALVHACVKGSHAEVVSWLEKGAKPDFFYRPEDHKNALHISAEHGFLDIIETLLSHGAHIDAVSIPTQSTALIFASQKEQPLVIRVLLGAKAAINAGMSKIFLFTIYI